MTGAVIQARMGSSRLPGKVLMPLAGHPVLWHVVERLRRATMLQKIIVATSTDKSDDPIAEFCTANNIECYRGSLTDVLARYEGAAQAHNLSTVVRITADCPLIDPAVVDKCVEMFAAGQGDYLSNINPGVRTFARGLDVEVFSREALARAHAAAQEQYEREHVTPYIWQNKQGEFVVLPAYRAPAQYAHIFRLTLDYAEDYAVFEHLYKHFFSEGGIVDVPRVLQYLSEHPEVAAINASREAEYPAQGLRV